MEYKELEKLLDNDNLKWETGISKVDSEPEDKYFNMSLQEFLDSLFWAGGANFDDEKWTSVPQRGRYNMAYLAAIGDIPVKFSDGKHEYRMKLVAAENDTVKVGEPFWWETPTVRTKYYTPDWEYATMIEITKQGDRDILRIWQTYGEPHGSWEWDITKKQAAINYESILSL
jgi:hypothetical protein